MLFLDTVRLTRSVEFVARLDGSRGGLSGTSLAAEVVVAAADARLIIIGDVLLLPIVLIAARCGPPT